MNLFGLFVFVFVQLISVVPVHAAEPTLIPTQPSLPTSPIMITGYQASTDGLDLVQLYNNSDELVSLDGMQLRYSNKLDQSIVVSVFLDGFILPETHVLIAAQDVLVTSDRVLFRFMPSGWTPKAVWVESPEFANVTIPSDVNTNGSIYKRGRTTTGYSTAASAFSPLSGSNITLEADFLYTVPPSPNLEIIEISARSKTCSPFDTDATCSDYIKLRMLNDFDISETANYRVKTGSGDSVTNSFWLANASVQGNYLLLRVRDDGDLISLTNSGGFIWLEDAYEIQRYENTLVEYADAGSESFINQSWALNDQTNVWQWGIPNPVGLNIFPVLAPVLGETVAPCPAGKYRNPETNRCRSIEEAVNSLAACEEGKERNPVTNRCRSIVTTAIVSLTPCESGEERNPLTNRCRKVTTASALLVPCDPGEERSTETNRCRKISSNSKGLATVTDIKSDSQNSPKWWLALVALALALGYAVFEWRQDIKHRIDNLKNKLTK